MFNTSKKYASHTVYLLVIAGIHIQCGLRRADPVSSLQNSQLSYTTYEGQTGQRKKLLLADSSTVILNAGSRLLVPENFPKQGRELVLDGEAFFEAAAINGAQPFVVKTDILTITALGTAFKIRSFAAQPGATAYLLNGKAKVAKTYHSPTDNQPEILERGQMVLANKEIDLMEKETFDPAELEAWLKEDLRFRDMPFMTVTRQLEDWYAVTITVKGDVSAVKNITASFRSNTLQQVLDVLCKQVGGSYRIKEGAVQLIIKNE